MKRIVSFPLGLIVGLCLATAVAQTATPSQESKGQLCLRISAEYYARANTNELYGQWFPLWQQHFYATAATQREVASRLNDEALLSELGF